MGGTHSEYVYVGANYMSFTNRAGERSGYILLNIILIITGVTFTTTTCYREYIPAQKFRGA